MCINSIFDAFKILIYQYKILPLLEHSTGKVQFYEARAGLNDCTKSCGEDVSDYAECLRAMFELKMGVITTGTNSRFHKGCYVYRNSKNKESLGWNSHSVGGTNQRSSPICKYKN